MVHEHMVHGHGTWYMKHKKRRNTKRRTYRRARTQARVFVGVMILYLRARIDFAFYETTPTYDDFQDTLTQLLWLERRGYISFITIGVEIVIRGMLT